MNRQILVIGRIWQGRYNPYHSVKVFVDGHLEGFMNLAWGRSDMVQQHAVDILSRQIYKVVSELTYNLYSLCEKNGDKLTIDICEVKRKEDLK